MVLGLVCGTVRSAITLGGRREEGKEREKEARKGGWREGRMGRREGWEGKMLTTAME